MKAQARKRRKKNSHRSDTGNAPVEVKEALAPQPVNLSDGIPDRAENPSRWRLLLVVFVFAVWVGFLIYCLLMGRLNNGAM